MKKNILKVALVTGFVALGGLTATLLTVNAQSIYDDVAIDQQILIDAEETGFTLEEMLTYAIQDEYLAQAEYIAIIETFGEIRPFTNIVSAEQTHIDLLLPLFAAYGIEVPANTAADSVIIPDSITSALATGVEAEKANIAMYEAFLAQADLPEDVAAVFTSLLNGSYNHLAAFSKDRLAFVGQDMMNQFKNQFGKGGKESQSQNKGSKGNAGVCPQA
jgi:hypothetical protein